MEKNNWMENLVVDVQYTQTEAKKWGITRQWMDGSITPLVLSINKIEKNKTYNKNKLVK